MPFELFKWGESLFSLLLGEEIAKKTILCLLGPSPFLTFSPPSDVYPERALQIRKIRDE